MSISKKKLLIVGAHGSGEIAMTVFEDINRVKNEWEIEGFINDVVKPGSSYGRYKVVGGSDSIKDYVNKGYYIHYTFHFNAQNKKERVKIFESLNIPIEANATGIHPLAYVNPESKVGHGCLLLPFAATSAHTEIKNFVHLYTGSYVGHNTSIGNYSTVAAYSVSGARVNVEKGVHIGIKTIIREDVTIGQYSILGMGSVVLNNVGEFETVVGNPARFLRNIT